MITMSQVRATGITYLYTHQSVKICLVKHSYTRPTVMYDHHESGKSNRYNIPVHTSVSEDMSSKTVIQDPQSCLSITMSQVRATGITYLYTYQSVKMCLVKQSYKIHSHVCQSLCVKRRQQLQMTCAKSTNT